MGSRGEYHLGGSLKQELRRGAHRDRKTAGPTVVCLEDSCLASCLGNFSSPGVSFFPDLCGSGTLLISLSLTQASGKPRPRDNAALSHNTDFWVASCLWLPGASTTCEAKSTDLGVGAVTSLCPLPSAPPTSIWDRGPATSRESEGALAFRFWGSVVIKASQIAQSRVRLLSWRLFSLTSLLYVWLSACACICVCTPVSMDCFSLWYLNYGWVNKHLKFNSSDLKDVDLITYKPKSI